MGEAKSVWEWRVSGPALNWDELARLGDTARSAIPGGLSFESGRYLAGGSIVRALRGEDWADLDIWVPRGEVVSIASALVAKGWTIEAATGDQYPAAAGLRRCLQHPNKGYSIDLIAHIGEGPRETIRRFDFRAVTVAFDGARLIASRAALSDIATRRLVATRRAMRHRIDKYVSRGWALSSPMDEVVLPEACTWEQSVGRAGVPVGAPAPAPEAVTVPIVPADV